MIDAQTAVQEARGLFNEGKFWHVHEALENVWRVASGDEKKLLQGLILAAASLVHLEKQHQDVCWRMMGDALSRLEDQPADYHGWDIARFRNHLQNCAAKREWLSIQV